MCGKSNKLGAHPLFMSIMTDELIYRVGTINDQPQLKRLGLLAYGEFSKKLAPDKWEVMRANQNDDEKLLQLIKIAKVFVCTIGDVLVGMAYLVPHGNPTNIYPAEWSYIRLVGVDPQHRGKGIAKTLTQKCIDHARASGEKTIALHTSEIMDAARHIYEGFGFKALREIDNPFGVRYWLYTMELTT